MSEKPQKSSDEQIRKRKRERDPNQLKVNCANSQVKWWMVKVPKYLGQKWLDSPKAEVGKLQIRQLGQRVEVNFKLDQDLADMGDRAPVDHKVTPTPLYYMLLTCDWPVKLVGSVKVRDVGDLGAIQR